MTSLTRRRFLAGAGITAAALASRNAFADRNARSRLADDPLRPQFHLLPAANWMNDPDGPIYFDGRYHMFYQYNPDGAYWGNMHWAHATSPDMMHWHHEPIALAPTPNGYDRDGVFSGCTVIHDDKGRLTPTIIYTGVLPPESPSEITLNDGQHKWREIQAIATSRDGLRTWQKDPDPVLAHPPEGARVTGFRDPCVWREGGEWMMAIGSGFVGKGGAILLYRSSDLRKWTYMHPLFEGRPALQSAVNPVDNGDMWECPDFFPLGGKHVLLMSTKGLVLWYVGNYKDHRFTAEKDGVVDYGAYYAARTQLSRDAERILWGWIPERRPESEYRAAGWSGSMALPRLLWIDDDGTLAMTPAPALKTLRGQPVRWSVGMPPAMRTKALDGMRVKNLAGEIRVELEPDTAVPFNFKLHTERGEIFARITYRPGESEHQLQLNETYASFIVPAGQSIRLRLLVDGSVLELFGNDSTAITDRVYKTPASPLRVTASDFTNLRSLDVWPITPISKDRLTT
jgi:beta-fructofuranosidase